MTGQSILSAGLPGVPRFSLRCLRAAGVLVALGAVGCATLPSALAPVPAPTLSALELEQAISRDSLRLNDFAADGVIVLPDGETVLGRGAVGERLRTTAGPGFHSFEIFPTAIYRCAPDLGLERGTFRAERRVEATGYSRPVAGAWEVVWRRSPDDTWSVHRAEFLRPGARQAPVDDDCVEAADEVRGTSRLSFSVHLTPAEYRTADPHANTPPVGRYPYRSRTTERIGGQVGAFYRFGTWFAAGTRVGLDPRVISRYRSPGTDTTTSATEALASSTGFLAGVARYEGRHVALDAGPSLVRSRWEWDPMRAEAGVAVHTRLGAVVSLHATIPLQGDWGLDLLAQHRWLGTDAIPGSDGVSASHNGWYAGAGLAIRSGR